MPGGLRVAWFVQGDDLAQALLTSAIALIITSLEGWVDHTLADAWQRHERIHRISVYCGHGSGTVGNLSAMPILVLSDQWWTTSPGGHASAGDGAVIDSRRMTG